MNAWHIHDKCKSAKISVQCTKLTVIILLYETMLPRAFDTDWRSDYFTIRYCEMKALFIEWSPRGHMVPSVGGIEDICLKVLKVFALRTGND